MLLAKDNPDSPIPRSYTDQRFVRNSKLTGRGRGQAKNSNVKPGAKQPHPIYYSQTHISFLNLPIATYLQDETHDTNASRSLQFTSVKETYLPST